MRRKIPALLVLSALLLCWPGTDLRSQENSAEAQFAADSLRYRTALHYDPLLDGPLESLVKLYVSAERTEELIGLYRSHIEQYPKDAGAKAVLARILRRVDPARAEAFIAESVPLHPNFAPLQYVLFRFLEDRGDPRANEVLSRAIELESNATRRYEWLDQLLRLSESAGERALAQAHFDKWLAPQDLPIDTLLGLARLMQRHQFWQSSTVALNRAAALLPPAETEVDIQYMLAVALSHEGKSTEAGRMLDALLKRLAPDHWRRREILSLRLQVVATPEERLKTVAAFKEAYLKNPDSESAALDYAEVLTAGELRSEALDVLLEASARLPKSALLEAHALELLDAGGDIRRYARYLSEKLENDPERLDLRFRLVKAQYALEQDAAAEQDFKTVVAGLGTEEASARILELQRYLRSIDRNAAAAAYLESYVRNHPTRLDVARELAEIRIASGGIEAVTEMVKWLQPEEAEAENVLDFSEFLLKENLVHAARSVIEAKLVAEPRQFELGLRLIEILGRAGDAAEAQKAISSLRELADTPPRYASWLEASITAHRNLESLPGFLETELNRYNFDEGKWSTEKIDKFLILCESSRQLLTAGRVTEGVRRQLAQPGLEASHKLRLRKVLVTILESDPASAAEVEEQLKQLSTEDPSHRSEYELQRALVYHRSQRDDLAQGLLSKVDLTEVADPALLREVSDLLVGYGFVREAETALATINRLEPGDLLSWERRVSLLATLGQESMLRSVIRLLRSGDTGIVLRELSNLSLEAHLDASYWRSIAALFKGGSARLGEVLPLLESADREAGRRESGLWSEWTRAYVLTRQGLFAEAEQAVNRFRQKAAERSLEAVRFPNGLELSVAAADAWLAARSRPEPDAGRTPSGEFLLGSAELGWAFELPEGTRLLTMQEGEGKLLLHDDADSIWALDSETGKLAWTDDSGSSHRHPTPAAFTRLPSPASLDRPAAADAIQARAPSPFVVSGERFFLVRDREIHARAVADGSILWTSPLAPEENILHSRRGARPEPYLAVAGNRVVVFDPLERTLQALDAESGKLLWHTGLAQTGIERVVDEGEPSSLNCGLSLDGDLAFAYGSDSVIADLGSGRIIWRLDASLPPSFPVVLRPYREDDDVGPPALPATALPQLRLFDIQATEGSGLVDAIEFLEGPSALLTPALHWSISRLARNEPALGRLAGGTLWLLNDGKIRRVSSDLPMAARELSASGALVGTVGKHLWLLDGDTLRHVDFSKESSARIPLAELGNAASLRATLVGNQIVVRGESSWVLVNAITGAVLGRAAFPTGLADYLSHLEPVSGDHRVFDTWQGRIHRSPTDSAGICLPVQDLVSVGRCYSVFHGNTVVCLEPEANASAVTPPAPQ